MLVKASGMEPVKLLLFRCKFLNDVSFAKTGEIVPTNCCLAKLIVIILPCESQIMKVQPVQALFADNDWIPKCRSDFEQCGHLGITRTWGVFTEAIGTKSVISHARWELWVRPLEDIVTQGNISQCGN